jgi:hypothetical protein
MFPGRALGSEVSFVNCDFDHKMQKEFIALYSGIPHTNWNNWLTISSREEYESTAVALSGLSSLDDLVERVQKERTDPKSFSVNMETQVPHEGPLVLCHTSGTSGKSMADVKWFSISRDMVTRLWAPGMQAIFEASGLTPHSSAVIFVPSRSRYDGLSVVNGNPLINLYSAEFSQRLALSLVQPRSYLLHQYKDAGTLQVIAKILALDRISVVSAPVMTVLGWADVNKLRSRLEKSLDIPDDSPEAGELRSKINSMGVRAAAAEVRDQLSDALSSATMIFSITGVTEKEWTTLRTFLGWEKGAEQFTNLYVGSEIGPFAASIGSGPAMYVFPLTVPVVEHKGERDLLSRSSHKVGQLLVSRMHNCTPVINIDTGDVITVETQEGLPVIGGDVLRAGFRLKTTVHMLPEVRVPHSTVYVGSYFDIEGLQIKNPRKLGACLAEQCTLDRKSPMILRREGTTWELVIPSQGKTCRAAEIIEVLSKCPGGKPLGQAFNHGKLQINLVDEISVKSEIPRSELLKQVRKGDLPKGVLMRWPLYVVVPSRTTSPFV